MSNKKSDVLVNNLVVGHFRDPHTIVQAIKKLREDGYKEIRGYSPFPSHELEEELYRGERKSPVRFFTLIGGLSGCLGAFLMTSWMSVDYPLRTSAKPLLSIPAFVVIAFECTILLGAIFTLLSMGHFSKVPNLRRLFGGEPGFKPEFTNGTFGLVVQVEKSVASVVKEILENCGASKVEVDYVR